MPRIELPPLAESSTQQLQQMFLLMIMMCLASVTDDVPS